MDGFKFNMGDRAELKESGETGEIIGRAEYVYMERHYLLRYRAGDGRQVEIWHSESAFA